MPNREQRRSGAVPEKRVRVEDADGNLYEIFMSDISGRDEFDFMQLTNGIAGGLCDMFLEGKVTLVGIAGLIWAKRRKYEKKLTVQDVMETVSMASIETIELDDGKDSEASDDDPVKRLEEARRNSPPGSAGRQSLPVATTSSDGASDPSSPSSAASTV